MGAVTEPPRRERRSRHSAGAATVTERNRQAMGAVTEPPRRERRSRQQQLVVPSAAAAAAVDRRGSEADGLSIGGGG